MSREERLYLEDVRDSCAKIQRYVHGLTLEQFVANEMMVDAVLRNLIVIGEAARQLSDALKARYPVVEWQKITSLRNIVTHVYFGIDEDIIWDIVQHKLPVLQQDISHILEAEYGDASGL